MSNLKSFNSHVIKTSNAANIARYYFNSKPVMDTLPRTDQKLFREHLQLKRVRKGKDLFREGSYPKGVYILKRGKVKLYQQTQNGNQQIIYIYTPGEMFGYRPLLCDERHPASAKTLEECGIYFLPAKHFLNVLERSASLSHILLQNLSHEFTVWVNLIAAFGQKSAKERMALALLILREKYKTMGSVGNVEVTLSRTDLAAFIGTTIETVARLIAMFKAEGLIKIYGRKIIMADTSGLSRLAECLSEGPQ